MNRNLVLVYQLIDLIKIFLVYLLLSKQAYGLKRQGAEQASSLPATNSYLFYRAYNLALLNVLIKFDVNKSNSFILLIKDYFYIALKTTNHYWMQFLS